MASVIPQHYGNDYSTFYDTTTTSNITSLESNKKLQNEIQKTMQHYLKNEEYNENTKDIYYGQYINIFNITLGIIGLTYSIYSTFFSVNTKMIRGGRR